MGSNAQRRREAREKVQEMRRQEAAAQRRRSSMYGIGLAVIVVLAIGGIAWAVKVGSQEEPPPPPVAGLQTYENEAGHTPNPDDPVEYEQTPPVGGMHSAVWQNCGIYEEPIRNENGVHSLEHGAVWITYDPNLPQEEIETLNALDDNYMLVSPYPGLESPVVASAWNTQVVLDRVDDPRLQDFITQFRQGPQTLEPGAPCDGGTSDTVVS